ncbi:hypothetical protein [Pseudorhizobium endolithicum]|nr:hypothetical protein [Pseudorhizobium endolithicum]
MPPELGEMDGKSAAALSGLAPIIRRSGQWTDAHSELAAGHRPVAS